MGEKLGLTQDQRARVQTLFDSMKSEAMPIGEKLLSQEVENSPQSGLHLQA
jgi:hypothetical protein